MLESQNIFEFIDLKVFGAILLAMTRTHVTENLTLLETKVLVNHLNVMVIYTWTKFRVKVWSVDYDQAIKNSLLIKILFL